MRHLPGSVQGVDRFTQWIGESLVLRPGYFGAELLLFYEVETAACGVCVGGGVAGGR